jgi:hypothetical protein
LLPAWGQGLSDLGFDFFECYGGGVCLGHG